MTLNPRLRRTANKKGLNYSILTDDTSLTDDTPLTNDTTPLTVNTAIRAKSVSYAVNLDVGL